MKDAVVEQEVKTYFTNQFVGDEKAGFTFFDEIIWVKGGTTLGIKGMCSFRIVSILADPQILNSTFENIVVFTKLTKQGGKMAATVEFTRNEIERATEFAKRSAPTTYNRRGELPVRHERNIRISKLGEIAFAKFLRTNGKELSGSEDMFTVWEDIYKVDRMDFHTSDGKTIYIKTASESYHTRILVPHDQYRQQRKDYYVGVRIFAGEVTAEVVGFAAWAELEPFGGGDYPAYARALDSLHPISELLDIIPDAQQ